VLLEGSTMWRLDTVSEDIEKREKGKPKVGRSEGAMLLISPKANKVTEGTGAAKRTLRDDTLA
jgi:hypothetical protein